MENKVTKAIMVGASLSLGLVAVALIFASEEWSDYFGVEASTTLVYVLQVLGSYMAAFSILNWMSKGMTLGGIYGRPIVLANFLHFFMNAIIFVKLALSNGGIILWFAAILSSIFTAIFARLMFGRIYES